MTEEIKDGIYFRMPEEKYLAENRLSKSGIKKMRISPADYWHESFLNPKREKRDTAALAEGSAYHCAILEPDRFAETYVRELDKSEMPAGTLFTGGEMKEWLKENGLKQTGSVKEQADRIAEADPSQPVWQTALAEWQASIKPGQIAISPDLYDTLTMDMERVHSIPSIHSLLSGGASEVSVFWTDENGIKMKARFDYLKNDCWIELKTFANPTGKNLNQCLLDAIRYNRYYIDAAAYMEASEAIRSGSLDVMGEAADGEREIVAAIKQRASELDCHFIFCQKMDVPNILSRKWRFFENPSDDVVRELEESGATPERISRARQMQAMSTRYRTAIYIKGRMEIAAAKRDFVAMNEIYEKGEPWFPVNPSGEITDMDFNSFWLEEAI